MAFEPPPLIIISMLACEVCAACRSVSFGHKYVVDPGISRHGRKQVVLRLFTKALSAAVLTVIQPGKQKKIEGSENKRKYRDSEGQVGPR